MADEQSELDAIDSQDESPKRSGRGLFRLIKAVAFVSVIVVVQVVVASMLAPSAKDTQRLAQELAAATSGHDENAQHADDGHAAETADAAHDDHDLHEVELGTYNVTRYNPATNTTLAIDFELYGTVLADDVTEFEHRFENSNARIKEQITLTMHGSNSADLTDAGLGLIKRQILEKTNRAMGQPLLKEVLFSKFNFVER